MGVGIAVASRSATGLIAWSEMHWFNPLHARSRHSAHQETPRSGASSWKILRRPPILSAVESCLVESRAK
jgi:hypothetical protein